MRRPGTILPVLVGVAALVVTGSVAVDGPAGATPQRVLVTPHRAGSPHRAVTTTPSRTRAATSARPVAGSTIPSRYTDWTMYHGTADHSGNFRRMPAASGTPEVVATLALDGAVYASPLVVGGRTLVATENDSVYAFGPGHRQLWRAHLGEPSPPEQRQCGDIDPLGITGTPVYDPASDSVFVVAELGGDVRHVLFALDPVSGAVRWQRSVDLPGVSARDMQQRGALALAYDRVWVSFGAQAGDCGDYKGRVVGALLDGSGRLASYTPPTQRGGGIWNAAGPTRDTDGSLLAVSANGAAFPGDRYDHTNTVLRLGPRARLLDSFAPSNWATNNRDDVGLGSQGVALVGSTYAVLGGKSGPVYVLRRSRLGGIGGEVSQRNVCKSYGGAAVSNPVVVLPCVDGDQAVRVTGDGRLVTVWRQPAASGSPVIGGGRVWTLAPSGGVLYGLDPATGAVREQVDVGTTSRFATPALSGPFVLVPTLSGLTVVQTS